MPSRKAHRRNEVPDSWLAAVQQWRNEAGMTLDEFGEAIGQAIGEKAYSGRTVARFLQGKTTVEMTEAIIALTGLALPPRSATTVEELRLWQEYGEKLWLDDRRHFLLWLRDLGELVDLLERKRQRVKSKTR